TGQSRFFPCESWAKPILLCSRAEKISFKIRIVGLLFVPFGIELLCFPNLSVWVSKCITLLQGKVYLYLTEKKGGARSHENLGSIFMCFVVLGRFLGPAG